MKCPVCQKDMQITGEDISYGNENKEYRRQRFHCEADDTWAILEVPKDKLANLA